MLSASSSAFFLATHNAYISRPAATASSIRSIVAPYAPSHSILFYTSFRPGRPSEAACERFYLPCPYIYTCHFSPLDAFAALPDVRVSGRPGEPRRHPFFDGRAKKMSNARTTKKAITTHGNGFYSYPSLFNYTIFIPKSTGKPLFYRDSASYPQYFTPC